jgi:hypothetical protein
MADTNATRLGFIREVTAGLLPASPAFTRFRYTGAPDLGKTPTSQESEEILDSGELTDTSVTAQDIGGSVNIEFSHESYDDLLEGAMRGTYQTKRAEKTQALGLDVSDANTILVTTTAPLAIGDVIFTQGYANGANNGVFVISAVVVDVSIDVTLIGGGAPGLIAETAPAGAAFHVVGDDAATNIDASAASGGTATLTATGADWTTYGLLPGDFIRVIGFSQNVANDGFYRVVDATSATVLTVDQLPDGYAADDGTGGDFVIFLGERLQNATDRFTYSIQELFTDVNVTGPNELRQLLFGCGVNLLSLQIDSEAFVTGSMTFVGEDAVFRNVLESGETFVEAPATTPLNTSSDVARVFEGGGALDSSNCVQSMSVEVNNNLEKKPCVGKVGGAGFRRGQYSVSGAMTTYFDDESKVEKVTNNTETSINLGFIDPAGRSYVLDMPRVKFTEGGPSVPGRNDDVIADLAYQALRDATFGYTTKLMRFWATS